MSQFHRRCRRAVVKGIVPSHAAGVNAISHPGDIAIVKREVLRSLVIRCPDGCGDVVTINLDPRTDKAWRLYNSNKGITLFPSVWRDSGCESHFILWNGRFHWMDDSDVHEADGIERKRIEGLTLAAMRTDKFLSFVEIADSINEIPWAVSDACHQLVKKKNAIEGEGQARNCFRRIES